MSSRTFRSSISFTAGLICLFGTITTAWGEVTKDQLDAAKYEQELRVLQATADLQVKQKEAEARKAIADAEKAELAAKLPATDTKALAGKVNTEKFGAAALVKAFDLARDLSKDVCMTLKATPATTFAIHEPTIAQGIVTARLLEEGITKTTKDLDDQNKVLKNNIDPSFENKGGAKIGVLLGLGAVTSGMKAVADLASLAKQDVTITGATYGTGTRGLFISALAENCKDQVTGLGSGYMGELDLVRYRALTAKVQTLVTARSAFADSVTKFSKQVEAAKGETKEPLSKLLAASTTLLKVADTFIEGLKIGDGSDKSPLYNAARFLAYSDRIAGSSVLDFDLLLEGMSITKDSIFTGQRLSLSAVALFWYRLHSADGTLIQAKTIRRITPPIAVDLKGDDAPSDFWQQK